MFKPPASLVAEYEAGEGYASIYRYGAAVLSGWGADAVVASEVGGVKITVPGGVARDRAGNLNLPATRPLYLAHNWKASVSDASAREGIDGTIDFQVTLNARDDCKTVTVDWATEDGTATADQDYTAASGTLTFGPGETTKTVSVVVLDDSVEDSGETFTLRLSNASGVEIADAEATGTITNTESAEHAESNTPATGRPTISGLVKVGATLMASVSGIADADGLTTATFAYQWVSNDGSADTGIEDATEASYTIKTTDVGKTIKVRVTLTDDGGTEETLVSDATAAVARAELPPDPEGAPTVSVNCWDTEAAFTGLKLGSGSGPGS